MLEKVKMFFWLCSGASISLLRRCPTEQSKYVGIGATIFFTGLLAAISSAYALYSVFDSLAYAIIFGIIWGLMIFNLDRFIVLSMRKYDKKHIEYLQAIPRVILAVLIAIVISKPLEVKIFEKEISSELTVLGQEILKEQEESVKQRQAHTLDSIRAEISRLSKEIELKQIKRDELFKIAQQEADGTGGSKKRNPGPIYRIKEKDAQRVQNELTALETKNMGDISRLEQELLTIQENQDRNFEQLSSPDLSGLSFKLIALNRLGDKYFVVWLANWFIILLFIVIEITPIFSKIIAPTGPYDDLLEVREYFYSNYRKQKNAQSNVKLEKALSKI